MELFLIDAIGPFFKGYQKRTINWSKIPFEHIETEDQEKREVQFSQIRKDMVSFAKKVSKLGYNAATLDDLAHLADSPLYEEDVRQRIQALSEEFDPLIDILEEHGLTPYITADILSYSPKLKENIGTKVEAVSKFLAELIEEFFNANPKVGGIIFRIGESDGQDVKNQRMTSELVLRKPKEVNYLLNHILPVFEKHGKKLILRTWTVGAYRIGDLIWHRGTLHKTLRGIDSEAFILSMKYGESDFFRHLSLNRAFFRAPQQKIIELQGRREYEGCGEYPSFIGNDYEHLETELRQAENVVGMSMWCQTGGWVPFRRLAFLQKEAIWNEINASVSLRLFRDSCSVEEAVQACAKERKIKDTTSFLEFLRLSEEVVKELIYIKQFAQLKLFFRRVRIPPLIGIYWDGIFVSHPVRKVLRHFVPEPGHAIREGYAALEKIDRMRVLAEKLGLPVEDIDYLHATGEVLAISREYYFSEYSDELAERIQAAKAEYKQKYPRGTRPRYRVRVDFKPFRLKRWHLRWSTALIMRKQRGYRLLDHLFTLHLMSLLYRTLRRKKPKWIPQVARESAMGIDAIFR